MIAKVVKLAEGVSISAPAVKKAGLPISHSTLSTWRSDPPDYINGEKQRRKVIAYLRAKGAMPEGTFQEGVDYVLQSLEEWTREIRQELASSSPAENGRGQKADSRRMAADRLKRRAGGKEEERPGA